MKKVLTLEELKEYRKRIMYALQNMGSCKRMIEHYCMLTRKDLLNQDANAAWEHLNKTYDLCKEFDTQQENMRMVLMDMDKQIIQADPEAHQKFVKEFLAIINK